MKAEQFIKDYTRGCSNEVRGWDNGELILHYQEWLTPDQALRAVEIAKEEMIIKAATWFANRYQANGSYLNATDTEDFIKEMKGE